jgi:hypothetical protein
MTDKPPSSEDLPEPARKGFRYVALTMLYFALYANAQHGWAPVSPWAADWLRWLYGDTAQALLGQS